MTQANAEEAGFSPDERVLCSDDACIGLVGPDGLCKVCRRPGDPAALAAVRAAPSGPAPDDAPAGDEVGDVAVVDESAHPEEADDFTERRLCPDDACIGVLDSDGRCKVCGRQGLSP